MVVNYLKKLIFIGALLLNCASSLFAMEYFELPNERANIPAEQQSKTYLSQLPKDMRNQLAKYLTKMEYAPALHYWMYESRYKSGENKNADEISARNYLRLDPTYRYGVAWDLFGKKFDIFDYDENKRSFWGYYDGHYGIKTPAPIQSVTIDKDSKYVLIATKDQAVQLYDLETGKHLSQDRMPYQFSMIRFNPAIANQVLGSCSNFIELYKLNEDYSLEKILSFDAENAHTDEIIACEFSPNGSSIATLSTDKTAKIWDAKTGKLVLEIIELENPRRIFFKDKDTVAITLKDVLKIIYLPTTTFLNYRVGQEFSCSIDPNGLRILFDSRYSTFFLDVDCKKIIGVHCKDGKYSTLFSFFDATGDYIFKHDIEWKVRKISDKSLREFLFDKISLEQAQLLHLAWQAKEAKQQFDFFATEERKNIFLSLPTALQETLLSKFRSFSQKSFNFVKKVACQMVCKKWS